MALKTTYAAETWDQIYQAFATVSFVSYDFDSIKQALVDYTQTYYPEHYNDYIQSSEFIAMIELFAYIAEQLAYRIDMVAHENFITTAQRKASILRLAKLISYKGTRNIPVSGLVKLTTVTTSEQVIDSRGVNLAGLAITWNDPNNVNWKEQFTLVMNRVLGSQFGQPQKTFQIGDVEFDLYSLDNDPTKLNNGVFSFNVSTGLESFPMEVVAVDIDANGPFEREPDLNSSLSLVYANDGVGDSSDYTGFLMFVKQGVLNRIDYTITQQLPNRRLDFLPQNVNNDDVWVQQLNTDGTIMTRWTQVDTINEENLIFNTAQTSRQSFEVDSLENDQISVVFGDGDFVDAPVGLFRFYMRQSANKSLVIQKNKIVNQPFAFSYTSAIGNSESCTFTFSLTSTLQNGSATETIEHIRASAPGTYYSQNRMVNGQDYNTFMLKDPSILKLNMINRTFAGQPKYIEWNDASGQYENVKLFGDDLVMRYTLTLDTLTTSVSGESLIDSTIEPLLQTPGILNMMVHISASDPDTAGIVSAPRQQFIQDNRALYYDKYGNPVAVYGPGNGSLKEKTAMQGLIDRHWYGEPLSEVVNSSGVLLGIIPDPTLDPESDSKLYEATLPRSIDGVNKYPPGDVGSGLQPVAEQNYFGLRYNRVMRAIGNGTIDVTPSGVGSAWQTGSYFLAGETWTIEVQSDGATIEVRSNLRGSFPTGTVGVTYQILPSGFSTSVPMFTMNAGTIGYAGADAFILDTNTNGTLVQRTWSSWPWSGPINLNGWWQVMGATTMPDFASGVQNPQMFTTSTSTSPNLMEYSWLIFVQKIRQSPSNNVIGYQVSNRDLKLAVQSPTTNFWYNSVQQITDSETLNRVYDNIKILGSNLGTNGLPIRINQVYDVVGSITDTNDVVDFSQLSIVPANLLQEDSSGNLIPDKMLQFETFAAGSYEYFALATPTVILSADPSPGNWAAGATVDNTLTYGRNLRMPQLVNSNPGLDFMWQHFSPFTNIIDPSVSNIHDAYIMTSGYYTNVMDFVNGVSANAPTAPTPLDLMNSYGYLLTSKMLSDTVAMHAGTIVLLFGALADPQLRAQFTVVQTSTSTLSAEQIKAEILTVINTYFDIDNWNFGDTFYATELIALIHQRLPADVASVVIVPLYSTNSFGSMFTIESGLDQILQSCAQLSDIVIVPALTPTVIRQG